MLKSIVDLARSLSRLESRLERMQLALGRIETRLQTAASREFQVFSQWGEDGIIAYLLSVVPVGREVFVEFGVEDYREANTRFLLQSRYWKGLILDGSAGNIARVRESELYWRYDLVAQHAFVTRENINQLLRENGVEGEIGLLSIDIDGNDYWVWEAIEAVKPAIVVVEYNATFGARRAVTIPYDPEFVRGKKHHSNLYYGASLAALERLGAQKGFALVATNRAGNNAFFVRKGLLGELVPLTAGAAYRAASFRESRDEQGALTFDDPVARVRRIAHLPLVDVETNRELSVGDL